MTGGPPLRTGNDGLGSAPSGLFTCRDGEILIQAGKDADFVKLCRVLGLESLTRDPRFERGASRVEKFHELKLLVNAATGRWERAALYAAMVKEGIICGPVNDVADALADPQVRANGVEQPGGHPDDPSLTLVGSPLRFAAGAPAIVRHPPRIGEHTVSVLQDLLGLEASAIASLAEKGVIGLPRESANSLAASERNGHAASLRLDTA
jgi:crotonobetainyl-CoA:carnitine CoA-transferase CaiB-like acyl-CoA transferase